MAETESPVGGDAVWSDEPLTTPKLVIARANLARGYTSDEDAQLLAVVIPMASALVRHHGLPWPNAASAPDVVKSITTEVAARVLMNPEGLSLERGDAVTFGRDDVLGLELSSAEKAILADLKEEASGTKAGVVFSVYAANTSTPLPRHLGARGREHSPLPWTFVPVSNGTSPIPFFHEDDGWWRQ